jgi:serine/threonine-protein kinase
MPAFVPIEIGSIVAKKYAIERILGEGGMGVVVAAQHTQLRQRVAIKFLLPSVVAHPEALARFVREARASVRIQSEHVARVLDVGELENGAPYIVMEYLEGSDLAAVLESTPPLTAGAVIEYVLQACEAVAEAHSLGIVHRDLKPANLFITRRPDGTPLVKVLDFGISKSLGGSDHALTKTTAFVGSPLYASPEQLLSSRSVDARTDIWALGVILYEACAGQPPFEGENVMEVASRVMKLDPVPLSGLRPDLPAELCAAIMCCLEKDVARRFATVGDLARALAPYAPHSLVSVDRISRILPRSEAPPPPGLGTAPAIRSQAPPPLTPTSTQAEWDQRVSRRAPSRVGPFALVIGALLVLATAGVALVTARRPPVAVRPEATSGSVASTTSVPASPPGPPLPEPSKPVASDLIATTAPSPSPSEAPSEGARSASLLTTGKPHASAPPPLVVSLPPASGPALQPVVPAPSATPPPRNPLDIKIK